MFNFINLGDEESALHVLTTIQKKRKGNHDLRILNSHITELNSVIGKRVFKKDALYVGYETLCEVIQPLGKKGKHNYHNLSPEEVYNALRTMKDSKDIEISYDNRYVIVTLATILENINIAVIVTPDGNLKKDLREKVTRIITLYPYKKK